jgi:hypothetical protein
LSSLTIEVYLPLDLPFLESLLLLLLLLLLLVVVVVVVVVVEP